MVTDYFYHDDPIEPELPRRRNSIGIAGFIVFLICGGLYIQTTLAANVSLNSGAQIEFGQGLTQTVACSGNTALTITPTSSFVNSSGGGAHYVDSVKVSNIPSSCNGYDFTLNGFGNSSSSPLALFNSTSSSAVVYNNNGTFELGVGTLTDASITSGSGTFTITFTNPVALSSNMFKLTIQSGAHTESASTGVIWNSRVSTADNGWYSVTYGKGIFVAVSWSGTGNRVMTSPDGITWTARTSAADNNWLGVTYGNGIFVAVSDTGSGNRVMTSTNGITWTTRASAADNGWYGVTYGNGTFVAVAYTGTGNRVMTSPDGVTWTSRTSASDNNWRGVTYGNGTFVAVAASGTGNRVMTSPDGVTWTSRTSAADNYWYGVTYGNGTFVAVAGSGTGNRVMTSTP